MISRFAVSLLALAGATLLAQATPAAAQAADAPGSQWEFVISSGRYLPLGAERDRVAAADQSTATLTRLFSSNFGVTASFGWARSRELLTGDRTRLNVFTYDAGAEWRSLPRYVSERVFVRSLVSAGVGVRSYDRRGVTNDAEHGAAAFAGIGAEAGVRRLRLRLELRDYVADAALVASNGRGRNDLAVLFGLRLEAR